MRGGGVGYKIKGNIMIFDKYIVIDVLSETDHYYKI